MPGKSSKNDSPAKEGKKIASSMATKHLEKATSNQVYRGLIYANALQQGFQWKSYGLPWFTITFY